MTFSRDQHVALSYQSVCHTLENTRKFKNNFMKKISPGLAVANFASGVVCSALCRELALLELRFVVAMPPFFQRQCTVALWALPRITVILAAHNDAWKMVMQQMQQFEQLFTRAHILLIAYFVLSRTRDRQTFIVDCSSWERDCMVSGKCTNVTATAQKNSPTRRSFRRNYSQPRTWSLRSTKAENGKLSSKTNKRLILYDDQLAANRRWNAITANVAFYRGALVAENLQSAFCISCPLPRRFLL